MCLLTSAECTKLMCVDLGNYDFVHGNMSAWIHQLKPTLHTNARCQEEGNVPQQVGAGDYINLAYFSISLLLLENKYLVKEENNSPKFQFS